MVVVNVNPPLIGSIVFTLVTYPYVNWRSALYVYTAVDEILKIPSKKTP